MKSKPSRRPRPSRYPLSTPWLGLAPLLGLDLKAPLRWPWPAPELSPDWPARLALALAFGVFWLVLSYLPRGKLRLR